MLCCYDQITWYRENFSTLFVNNISIIVISPLMAVCEKELQCCLIKCYLQFDLLKFHRMPPSRAMTPAQQMDIIRSSEEVGSKDDETISKRDLEVSFHVVTDLNKKSKWLIAVKGPGKSLLSIAAILEIEHSACHSFPELCFSILRGGPHFTNFIRKRSAVNHLKGSVSDQISNLLCGSWVG